MALQEILSQKPASPYWRPPPLHIYVVEMMDQNRVLSWEFGQNSATPGITKLNKVTCITDGKSVAKITLFEEFSTKVKEGESYIMKGYSVRGQHPPLTILINKQTLFFRASAVHPSEQMINAARDLLHPKSSLTPLINCHEMRGFVTVEGKVIEVSAVKKVTTNKEQVPFRTIVLQQEKTQVPLSLWREAAIFDVPLGGTLTLTHLKHANSQYGFQLQSTGFTKIEVEVSNTPEQVEVMGVLEASETEGLLKLLLADDTMLEIDQKLWQPFDEMLKVEKVVVIIKKVGTRITSIMLNN